LIASRNSGSRSGEIRVHLEYQVVFSLESPSKAGQIRCPESELLFAMNDVHAGIGGGDRIDDRASPIRRTIIHDQDFQRRVLRKNRGNYPRDVEALVVGWNND